MKSDSKVRETIKGKQTDDECRPLLQRAEAYPRAGMLDKARECVQKVIDERAGTPWAQTARERQAQIAVLNPSE